MNTKEIKGFLAHSYWLFCTIGQHSFLMVEILNKRQISNLKNGSNLLISFNRTIRNDKIVF